MIPLEKRKAELREFIEIKDVYVVPFPEYLKLAQDLLAAIETLERMANGTGQSSWTDQVICKDAIATICKSSEGE